MGTNINEAGSGVTVIVALTKSEPFLPPEESRRYVPAGRSTVTPSGAAPELFAKSTKPPPDGNPPLKNELKWNGPSLVKVTEFVMPFPKLCVPMFPVWLPPGSETEKSIVAPETEVFRWDIYVPKLAVEKFGAE